MQQVILNLGSRDCLRPEREFPFACDKSVPIAPTLGRQFQHVHLSRVRQQCSAKAVMVLALSGYIKSLETMVSFYSGTIALEGK